MGFLTPRDDVNKNPLGLSSRYEVPREIRKARDTEVGKSIARTQVVEMDMRGIEHAAIAAQAAVRNLILAGDAAAMQVPINKAPLIMGITNMAAIMLQTKLSELGGNFG
ncbi:hypothetical protein [Pseudonocardia sp. D17]|uniref:hypothetical protein n=1 Tax=Pseudonocardia sp. D17 TaxID=882661 RepID=UPI002B36E1E0|nr:hypothetical protein PSD17_25700 [Pseudonocardia sp. D17]